MDLRGYLPVEHIYHTPCIRGITHRVGNHNYGGTLTIELLELFHYLDTVP